MTVNEREVVRARISIPERQVSYSWSETRPQTISIPRINRSDIYIPERGSTTIALRKPVDVSPRLKTGLGSAATASRVSLQTGGAPAQEQLALITPDAYAKAEARVRKLVLLLPGHNEELIIKATIRSAIAAGQNIKDIYVVNDNSSDNTEAIAIAELGTDHVLTVERSGKALAVKQAIDHFKLDERYEWLHIADADSIFSPDYFRHFRKKLNSQKYAVALGFVQSLRGNWISTYRALTYTYSQHVIRRVQSKMGMISVFPGPITCFRTDIINKLEFGGNSLTEDFDITLQVHRKKLGEIVFIPKAVNYTQDPQSLSDFCKQNLRWQRGFFQGVQKYRVGFKGQRIDLSLGFQMFQTLLFFLQILVLIPLIVWFTGNWLVIPAIMAAEVIVNAGIAVFASIASKRWNLLGALPYFFFLRYLEIGIYVWAFVEVIILGKFQDETKGWSTAGRRYKLSSEAMLDVAQ